MSAVALEAQPTLLIVAPMLYHPACGNGGGVLCFELLRQLASRAQLHFVGFAAASGDESAALAALRGVAQTVTSVTPPPPQRWWRGGSGTALQQLLTGMPREVRGLQSERMREVLNERVATLRPDAVLLQFPHMAQYARTLVGVPVVVDVQDACMVSRFREWRVGSGGRLRRLLQLHAWWAWARYELRAYSQAHRLMALSEADLGVLRAYLPQVPSFLSPVAWDVVRTLPALPAGEKVLFMGNFAHAPNRDGLQWLLAEVWPRVRERHRNAVLQVAGINLPPSFVSDASAGVMCLGFVEDVKSLLAGSALSVVPYRFGGGIKIKAIESMAQGCPVVATSVGSEGLGAEDGVHLRVADSAAAFATAVVDLLAAPAQRQLLAQHALALVAQRFSWERKVTALLRELHALGQERRAAMPSLTAT